MSFDTGQSATNIHKMFLSARICFPPGLTSRARLFPCFHLLFLDDAMGAPLSLPPASPSLPLTCPPGRVRKDGGGDPPIFDAVVGGGHSTRNGGKLWRRLFGISMASVTWNFLPLFFFFFSYLCLIHLPAVVLS